MEFTDFLWLKLLAIPVIAFFWNLFGLPTLNRSREVGPSEGRIPAARQASEPAGPPPR